MLGIVYSIAGDGPWPIRLVQLVLGLGTVALIHASAQRLFGVRWALALASCTALYGPLIYFDGQLQVDGVAGVLQALLIFPALRAFDEPSPRRWLLAGITLGLAVVARPLALLYVVPLGIAAGRRNTSWRARIGLAIGLALPIAPVTLRNTLVAGEAVLVTDSGGLNLFIGNGPGAIGTFRVPVSVPGATHALGQIAAFRAVAEQAAGRKLTARDVDRYWIEKTLRWIRKHPRQWLRLMGEKFWLFWNRRELPNIEDYEFNRHINPVLHMPFVQFGWLAPVALLGSFALLVRRNPAGRLVGGLNAIGCLGIIAVFVLARYRIAVVPGLIIAAGAGARTVVDLVQGRRWILVGGVGLIVAGGVVLARAEKLPKPFDDEYFKLGYVYHVDGRFVEAERAYKAALALNQDNLSAHNNLASLYDTIGNIVAAKEHWLATQRIAISTGHPVELERARRQLLREEP
ncbi:MAG: glycosyltransferase family 39 protein [Myxococcales bacterium]